MQPSLPLLSIDPGSTMIGWALLNAGPLYVTSGVSMILTVPPVQRVPYIGHAVGELIRHYRPASVLLEVPDFIAHYAKPQIVSFFRAVGAVELVVFQYGLPIFHVPAGGEKGKGKKQKVITHFISVTGRPPMRDDESDAFANGWNFLVTNVPAMHQNGPDDDSDEYDDCGG